MEKGNVLVVGNSGVGKSTLINAALGEERALPGYGMDYGQSVLQQSCHCRTKEYYRNFCCDKEIITKFY